MYVCADIADAGDEFLCREYFGTKWMHWKQICVCVQTQDTPNRLLGIASASPQRLRKAQKAWQRKLLRSFLRFRPGENREIKT